MSIQYGDGRVTPWAVLKPTPFNYVSPDVPQTPPAAKPEAQVAPGLPSPEQMYGVLMKGGPQAVDLIAGANWRGMNDGVEIRRKLLSIKDAEARGASNVRIGETEHGLRTYGDVTKDLQNNTFGQAAAVAREIAAMNHRTTGAAGTAIAGEQANDAARLQLQRDVLMKPKSFGQTLGELTSAIAPIAALFV